MLINIVGCDGSGKTTQIEMLKPWMQQTFGCPVRVMTKGMVFDFKLFPESRMFGCSYRELTEEILPGMIGESRSLLLFYLLAVSFCRYPSNNDEIVLADGYWYKNYATEAALGIDPRWLRELGSFFTVPDISILLDVEPERTVSRIERNAYECGSESDLSETAFLEYQTKVLRFLRDMAQSENWIILDARASESAIFDGLKVRLQDRIVSLKKQPVDSLVPLPRVEDRVSVPSSETLDRELDILMARNDIKVPSDRRAGVFQGFESLRRMAALVRQPRPAECEPAYSFIPRRVIPKS